MYVVNILHAHTFSKRNNYTYMHTVYRNFNLSALIRFVLVYLLYYCLQMLTQKTVIRLYDIIQGNVPVLEQTNYEFIDTQLVLQKEDKTSNQTKGQPFSSLLGCVICVYFKTHSQCISSRHIVANQTI